MNRILLIEDDTRVSDLIKRGLEEEDFDVTVAFDGDLGVKVALTKEFDLIITDILLPKVNGLDLSKTIRQAKPDVPIIMLTALGTTDDKVEGFDSGADDYLVKPFEFRELLARIRVSIKRRAANRGGDIRTIRFGELLMDRQTKTVIRKGKEIVLTPKEFRLLEYMMQNPNRVLSRVEIAEKVWSTHFDTGTNFIDVYINYLRRKVDKGFSNKLIHTKPGMGFILKENENTH